MANGSVATVASRVELGRAVLRSLGPAGVLRRARYEIARRTDRVPLHAQQPPLRLSDRFAISTDVVRAHWHERARSEVQAAAARVVRIRDGYIDVYGRPATSGWPPQWRAQGEPKPWTAYSDSRATDIKDVWEPSRFPFVGPLLRADIATDEHSAAPLILRALDDWMRSHPPFCGENWMCGQEASLRGINVLFAVGVVGGPRALDTVDRELVEQFLTHTIERVSPTLGYALSQRNNHAISEATFLWLASSVLEPSDDRLRRRAARALRECIADQFAEDGSYAQYSFTYHRLALHTLLFLDLVCRELDLRPPVDLDPVFERSFSLLTAVLEPQTGAVPNAGGNDGALLFDLTDRPISDFRPVVAHLASRLGSGRPFRRGSWDEEAAWFGHEPASVEPRSEGLVRTNSYHSLRSTQTLAVLRAGSRRHRPVHADMLQVDIWIDGVNVAFDPGTYRYTAPAPWGNALTVEEVHNVPRLPGHPQGVRAGRFLWRSWSDASVAHAEESPVPAITAHLPLGDAILERTVALSDDVVVIRDRSPAPGMIVRWNLPQAVDVRDGTVESRGWSAMVAGGRVRRLEPNFEDPTSGWRSPTYGELVPCTAVEVVADGTEVVTAFGPDTADLAAAVRRVTNGA